ncbi:MAG: VWA domain-containing protein [Flavobacteriales bacterium]|nr:VWA domain-containing protein [Flavobacteriales bacterium]
MKHFQVILIVLLSMVTFSAVGQGTTRILFVFDASNSMNGFWEGQRKIETSTKLLSQTLEELYGIDNLEIGLRVYGHQTQHVPGAQDCDDTELVVPIGKGTNLVINKELSRLQPKGTTPIARSLEKAAGDFEDCEDCRNVIILITDGIEACDEDPCAVSKALQEKNIIVKPFIIGIGIDELYKSTFECVGNYFDATNAEVFETVLDIVISEALNNTSVQINLLDKDDQPVETNVPFTLYDQETGETRYNYVHTLNSWGNPDTLSFDPLPTYKLVVHTLPPVIQEGLTVTPGVHTVFDVPLPQGDLVLSFSGRRSDYGALQCIVSNDNCDIVHAQEFGSTERYIAGTYQLEILTTPRTIISDVVIAPGEETPIAIPGPGTLLLNTGTAGYGGVFIEQNNVLTTALKFSEGDPSGRYLLQPGKYKLVFRARNARQTLYTIEKEFTIKSGTNTTINLN